VVLAAQGACALKVQAPVFFVCAPVARQGAAIAPLTQCRPIGHNYVFDVRAAIVVTQIGSGALPLHAVILAAVSEN
jgi:hypothetical protein